MNLELFNPEIFGFYSAPIEEPLHVEQPGISISRHDDHNLEIKILRELTSTLYEEDFDLYLFIPKSFDIPFLGKSELQRDFRVRLRASIPNSNMSGQSEFDQAIERLEKSLILYNGAHENSLTEIDNIVYESCRETGATIVDWIKRKAIEHSKDFFLLQSIVSTDSVRESNLQNLRIHISELIAQIAKLRNLTGYYKAQSRGSIILFEEYVSYAYIQYLATQRAAIADEEIKYILDRAQEDEALHRQEIGIPDERRMSDEEREQRLVHLSLIKKIFQSQGFLNVTRQPVITKFSETTAVAGTACAGAIAAIVQRYNQPTLSALTLNGFLLICFGVFLYVLRDRIKDYAKVKFSDHVKKLLPDFEQTLKVQSIGVGSVNEWFSIEKKSSLPNEILALRRQAYHSRFEEDLGEEVLHYRRHQKLACEEHMSAVQPRALHEVIRLNIERYLKYMDDPIKETFAIDNYGKLFKSSSRRVYHFYLCLRSKVFISNAKPKGVLRRLIKRNKEKKFVYQDLIYRIVLSKSGLLRLEKIEF